MPRDVIGCEQGVVCGSCGYGCPLGAKQSTLRTWLEDAAGAGARIVVGARARRVLVENGRAAGVDAGPVQVRSRAVVAAAGAIETPALLLRSGLKNPNVGRGLRLHPATAVFGIFDEEIRPWEGTLQALYSDQFRFLDGGYGVKLETVPLHPALLTAALPWEGAAAHARLMASLPRLSLIAVIGRDAGAGRVRIGRDGEAIATYRLAEGRRAPAGDRDRRRRTSHGGRGRARDLHRPRAAAALGRRLPGGGVPLRPRPRLALLVPPDGVGAHGRVAGPVCRVTDRRDVGRAQPRDRRRLAFPTASGVNPMITIEAIAHLNAPGADLVFL